MYTQICTVQIYVHCTYLCTPPTVQKNAHSRIYHTFSLLSTKNHKKNYVYNILSYPQIVDKVIHKWLTNGSTNGSQMVKSKLYHIYTNAILFLSLIS